MEFNYLNLFKSYGILSDFVVPMVPTLSPSSPCHPRVIPVIPIAPRRSPWLWSPLSPPHVILTSSPHCPCHPHIVPIAPRRSPCGPHGCGLHCLHPMLSLWFPCHPHRPHIIPVSSPSSPRHLEGPHIIPNPPDTHSTHPLWQVGGPESVKMQ